VSYLLELQANPGARNNMGKTVLHTAMARGKIDIIEKLISAGGSLTEKDNKGMTPIHEAAYRGHMDCFHLISEKFSDIIDLDIKDDMGYTAADYLKIDQ
jgi:cytohesin